jgi:hypothetical protein
MAAMRHRTPQDNVVAVMCLVRLALITSAEDDLLAAGVVLPLRKQQCLLLQGCVWLLPQPCSLTYMSCTYLARVHTCDAAGTWVVLLLGVPTCDHA